jgi:hypothetical protein
LSINSIRQGETFGFETGLSGTDTEAFTNTLSVLQYPGDTPAITRTITNEIDTLTSAETAALAVGQWFIYIKSSDSDEDIREPVKLYIAKGWT